VKDPVNQGGFPMVNVGNDGDISDILHGLFLKDRIFEIGLQRYSENRLVWHFT
jgi:hypothetical protein